jgi:hypothetical protein
VESIEAFGIETAAGTFQVKGEKGGSANSEQGCGWRHNARVSEVEAWLVILPDRDRG